MINCTKALNEVSPAGHDCDWQLIQKIKYQEVERLMQTINKASSIYKPKYRCNGDDKFVLFPECVPESTIL